MIPYFTGAAETGAPQRTPGDSTGGFRSGTRFRPMDWDADDPMVGIWIVAVGGANGVGVGTLTATASNALAWTPPSGTQGTAVTIAQGEEAVLRGGTNPGAWIRVARRTSNPLEGAKAVTCVDVFENLFPDVVTADAVAGLVTSRAVMLLNGLGAVTDFEAWVGSGDIEIALEEPTGGELLGSGLSWSSATTEGSGPGLASVADAAEVGVHIRRTIAADAAPSPSETWEVRYSFTAGGTDYTGALRGRYKIERTDYQKKGIWVGTSPALDFDADPDETWTSEPHTTSLGLTTPGTYYAAVCEMNQWGMWGVPTAVQRYDFDAAGDGILPAPSAPVDITVNQTSGNLPTVGALYESAADGDNRAEIWVVWIETDGTEPDGSATPDGYVVMQYLAAINDLAYTGGGSALDDGTTVAVLVRTRRLDSTGGTAFSPDVIQLDDSNPGTLKVTGEITDWDATGYAKITNRFGKLLEVIHYSGISASGGQTTVTVDQRALWGTSGTATNEAYTVTPVAATDSENTTVYSWDVVAVAPGRPLGSLLQGLQTAQALDPLTAPDGVTPQVLDATQNVHLLLGEGWASLYVDTTLVWRVLLNGDHGENNALYIPSDWDLVAGTISGAASGSGIVDAVDANTVYLCVRGQRRALIDLSAMEITFGAFSGPATLRERAEQAGDLERFGSTMFLAWDPEKEDYRTYLDLDSDGLASSRCDWNNVLTTAEVDALWQP